MVILCYRKNKAGSTRVLGVVNNTVLRVLVVRYNTMYTVKTVQEHSLFFVLVSDHTSSRTVVQQRVL